MKWEVRGADRETGQDIQTEVEAGSEADAVKFAGRLMLIERVRPAKGGPPPKPGTPENPVPTAATIAVGPTLVPYARGARPNALFRFFFGRMSLRGTAVAVVVVLLALACFGYWASQPAALTKHALVRGFGDAFVKSGAPDQSVEGAHIEIARTYDRECALRFDESGGRLTYAHIVVPGDYLSIEEMMKRSRSGLSLLPPQPAFADEARHRQYLDQFLNNALPQQSMYATESRLTNMLRRAKLDPNEQIHEVIDGREVVLTFVTEEPSILRLSVRPTR